MTETTKPKAQKSRGGARIGTGGAMPGAGRKPDAEPKKPRAIRLSDRQNAMHMKLGGSGFYQGYLNLKIREQDGTT